MEDEQALSAAAQQQGQSEVSALIVLATLSKRLGSGPFFVYRAGGQPGGSGSANARLRTVLAFGSPDAALAFAQRNQLNPTPRLQRLGLARLLAALLQQPGVAAVLFVADTNDEPPVGSLPGGERLERATLLRALANGGQFDTPPS